MKWRINMLRIIMKVILLYLRLIVSICSVQCCDIIYYLIWFFAFVLSYFGGYLLKGRISLCYSDISVITWTLQEMLILIKINHDNFFHSIFLRNDSKWSLWAVCGYYYRYHQCTRLFLARQDVDKKSRQGKKILLRKRKAMICEGRRRKKEEVE